MLVTNKGRIPINKYLDFVSLCAHAGITSVQLREKNLDKKELVIFGQNLQEVLQPLNIPLIVNDDLLLAKKINAAGVHLGETDGDILQARILLGLKKFIGLTVNSIEQLLHANSLPIDYIGIGAVFATKNKKDVKNIWGTEMLKKLIMLTKHPVVAIGGIDVANIESVVAAGAHGIAAIDAFHSAKDPAATAKILFNAIRFLSKPKI